MSEKYEKKDRVEYLSGHLKVVESIKNHVLREFYNEQTEERYRFENLIDKYIANIKNIANTQENKNDTLANDALHDCWPLVLIGSMVEVVYLEYDETEILKIVPPFYQGRGKNIECASCLSPVGNALLLKKIGDKITVRTPLGESSLLIKSIELPSA